MKANDGYAGIWVTIINMLEIDYMRMSGLEFDAWEWMD